MKQADKQNGSPKKMMNAFCVDLEEWFHVGGLDHPYLDINTWDSAESHVEKNTEALLDLLAEYGHKGTFLTVGWIAEKYPKLIRAIHEAGHEVGSHGYYHRMVWTQTPDEFREEIRRSRGLLQEITGQEVTTFRAPCFSMKKECFWAYPILVEEGLKIDVSLVPAARDNGGVIGFERDPMQLEMEEGSITVFPVSVMKIMGKATQFSGGGHMRALPISLIERGFRQNHKVDRPVMAYIHPREITPHHPRVKELPRLTYFKAYMGMKGVEKKLRYMMKNYPFTTVTNVIAGLGKLPTRHLKDGEIV